MPLQAHVNQILASTVAPPLPDVVGMPAVVEPADAQIPDDGAGSIRKALSSLGVAEDVAHVLVNEARVLNPSADPLLSMAMISERFATRPVEVQKPQLPKRSKAVAPLAQDLRHVAATGQQAGQSG